MTAALRFAWRAARNLICAPQGTSPLFPPETQAQSFGRGDADYAIWVNRNGAKQLPRVRFSGAVWVLVIGPGPNIGITMMWSCLAVREEHNNPLDLQLDRCGVGRTERGNYRNCGNESPCRPLDRETLTTATGIVEQSDTLCAS